jgi:zinc-ribbon domain
MAYLCELGTGQTVYLENRDNLTIVTTISSGFGQQQQSSSSFNTGQWIAPPEIYQTPHGIILKSIATQGNHYIEIQENSHCLISDCPANNDYHQIPLRQVASNPSSSMPSMPSMQPMKMGNMQMNMSPMEMRMGNMVLQMGASVGKVTKQRFCSHCGAEVDREDRFCSSCGHALS